MCMLLLVDLCAMPLAMPIMPESPPGGLNLTGVSTNQGQELLENQFYYKEEIDQLETIVVT